MGTQGLGLHLANARVGFGLRGDRGGRAFGGTQGLALPFQEDSGTVCPVWQLLFPCRLGSGGPGAQPAALRGWKQRCSRAVPRSHIAAPRTYAVLRNAAAQRCAAVPCHRATPRSRAVQLCSCATQPRGTMLPCHAFAVQPCHVTVPCRLAVPYSCAMQPCGWGHRGAGGARRGPRRSPTRPWFLRLLGLGRVGLPLGEEAAQEAGSPLGVLPGVQAGLGGRGTTGLGGGGSCCVPGPRQVCRQLPPRFPFHLGLSWTPCPCSLCPRDPKIPRVPGHLASSRHPCPLDVPVCSHLPVSPGSPAPWPHAPSPLPAPRIKGFMQGQTSEQPESREPLPEAPETNM